MHLELPILTLDFALTRLEHGVSFYLVRSFTDLEKIAFGTSYKIVVFRCRNSLEEISVAVLDQLANLHKFQQVVVKLRNRTSLEHDLALIDISLRGFLHIDLRTGAKNSKSNLFFVVTQIRLIPEHDSPFNWSSFCHLIKNRLQVGISILHNRFLETGNLENLLALYLSPNPLYLQRIIEQHIIAGVFLDQHDIKPQFKPNRSHLHMQTASKAISRSIHKTSIDQA